MTFLQEMSCVSLSGCSRTGIREWVEQNNYYKMKENQNRKLAAILFADPDSYRDGYTSLMQTDETTTSNQLHRVQ